MVKNIIVYCCHFFLLIILFSCSTDNKNSQPTLFELTDQSLTNINFQNNVPETDNINPLQYENSYNGGGVAIGDVNNDGLDDIYFSGNKVDNKLYLNSGNFKFTDVTEKAGVTGRDSWKTGITMVDVNGDGKLDIYQCHSGDLPGKLRANELFINQGNDSNGIPVFKEEAEKYGLADSAYSTQAAFFDYDRDGDLDMILLNHSPVRFNNLDENNIVYLLHQYDSLTGLKLYQNNDGYFTDVSVKTGINCVRLNYNLAVSIADINNDNWPDLYISNDYLSPDYLYINNKNGTFTDSLKYKLSETSQFSMGNDVADINNDGLQDIYTLDMLPEDNYRQKILFSNDNFELFDLRLKTGLNAQYMRNMLHLNNGDGTFSETGQLSGVSNTDWSWAPLFADFDNDGWKDLYVTNGYLRDYTNMDFLKFMGDKLRDMGGNVTKSSLLELVKQMPSSNLQNYIFKNEHGVSFSKKNDDWGITTLSNSNGAAYADLDNDGDLDLVINNINQPVFVYRNNSSAIQKNNYLRIKLNGQGKNKFGVGAAVKLFTGNQQQVQQQLISRGFQSSVSPVMVFGTGKFIKIDSVKITWPSGKIQMLSNVMADTTLQLNEADAVLLPAENKPAVNAIFKEVTSPVKFIHTENPVNDFKRQPLLINSISYSGPCIAKADINGDGKEDIFLGGAAGQPSKIFLQKTGGDFQILNQPDLEKDSACEDAAAVFFDADGDGDKDLLVCSGGYDNFKENDVALQSRLYINDGKGHYKKSSNGLPSMLSSAGCVAVADVNGDKYPDLFIGGRVIPGNYPNAPRSYLLINDGKGNFTDQTQTLAPGLMNAGMFTDASFADINKDGKPDLVTVGEWMPVQIWLNNNGVFVDATKKFFDKEYYGWWNKLLVDDINNDGIPDLIVGNYGLNSQCRVSDKEPAELYYKDFDNNGSVDPIFCYYIQGKSYPYPSRDELLDQMSIMRTRFTDYKSYANAGIKDVFTDIEMKDAKYLKVNTLQSMCFIGTASGGFKAIALPTEAQYSPVFGMELLDYNADGKKDLLIGGNVSHSKIRFGDCHANHGMLFTGMGDGQFNYVPQWKSGLNISGDVRFISLIGNDKFIAGVNNSKVVCFQIEKK